MDRDHIIKELRRTATNNEGAALGWRRFEKETGIRYYDWYGKFWTKWSDAVRDAGLQPNHMAESYPEEYLLEKLIAPTRSLGRVPAQGDLLIAARNDSTFPSEKAFRRLGHKAQCVRRVVAFCEVHENYDDVSALWQQVKIKKRILKANEGDAEQLVSGFVYLVRHGTRKEYKIGRTINPLRREGEIGIQLPEKLQPIHYIETDDPAGVETYWHTRFAKKRKEGEWFALVPEDVRAFMRWKRIY